MTIHEALRLGAAELSAVPDPQVDAELLLCFVTGLARFPLRLRAAQPLPAQQESRYRALLKLRAARRPLQYILGTQSFFGHTLRVNESVLIPRQETETLCERALEAMKPLRAPAVADVCTGSGAIAVTLKKARPDAAVWAADVSHEALALARRNAAENAAEITFAQGDLLEPLQGLVFDGIVANPPYIPTGELEHLQPEVRLEPRMALDGGADGLSFYRRLAQDAPPLLMPDGWLFAEFGDGQADAVFEIFSAAFQDVRIHADLYGSPRIVQACRPRREAVQNPDLA